MSWSKPDLDRVRNAVLDCGFKAYPVRGNQFRCQCPVHQGVGHNVQFKLQPSGKISFECFSQHCGYTEMLDVLDLVNADFYPNNPLVEKARRQPNPSHAEWVVMCAEADIAQGKRLSSQDKDSYRAALHKIHGGAA